MASEPWYSIGPLDMFPVEFAPFLFADMTLRHIRERTRSVLGGVPTQIDAAQRQLMGVISPPLH
ncbi:hypothetical protein [Pseudomonas viridiflava]|uniref:hypothetical protein n=1 Tax=Pseudomonas viridiflava TaxID=33069 RepID=UPI0039B856D3